MYDNALGFERNYEMAHNYYLKSVENGFDKGRVEEKKLIWVENVRRKYQWE